MKVVRESYDGGRKHEFYDNGLVRRVYEGSKNEEWWHTDNSWVRTHLLWIPQMRCWRWIVHRATKGGTIGDFAEDQFDSAIALMRLTPC